MVKKRCVKLVKRQIVKNYNIPISFVGVSSKTKLHHVNNKWLLDSVAVLAEISLRSPRKLFNFYYQEIDFWDQSIQN